MCNEDTGRKKLEGFVMRIFGDDLVWGRDDENIKDNENTIRISSFRRRYPLWEDVLNRDFFVRPSSWKGERERERERDRERERERDT